MNLEEAVETLRSLGTEQNRKLLGRRGVVARDCFGVSYADLGKLEKRLRVDHTLAQQLWATGHHDARILATMIADPAACDPLMLERWVADVGDNVVSGALASLVARGDNALAMAEDWCESPDEWRASTGWATRAAVAVRGAGLTEAIGREWIATIERRIHESPNRVRHEMNSALIGVGLHSDGLAEAALAAADRIGRVVVDHGETACTTPDARSYIEKTRARRSKKPGQAAPRARARGKPRSKPDPDRGGLDHAG